MEGAVAYGFDAIRNRDARQADAASECTIPNTGDAVRNRDARQAGAARKGSIANGGNWISTNSLRND